MDLHAEFHQIMVHEAHVERTAFKTKYGTYQFKVMPFGLCNAPATFQRTMDFVLQDLRGMVGAYVDDILTGTDTLEDMVFALREVYVRWLSKSCMLTRRSVVLDSRRWSTVASLSGEMVFDHSR